MIEKQREKEFLFELERICHNYNLIIGPANFITSLSLIEVDCGEIDKTTENIEEFIDELRRETLEDVR